MISKRQIHDTEVNAASNSAKKLRTKTSAKTPAKVSAKTPAKTPTEATTKTSAKTSTEAPAKTPTEATAKTSAKTPTEAPAKKSAKVPAKTPAKTSASIKKTKTIDSDEDYEDDYEEEEQKEDENEDDDEDSSISDEDQELPPIKSLQNKKHQISEQPNQSKPVQYVYPAHSHEAPVAEIAPKKPRKAKVKKNEKFVEVIPIQFHCPNPKDKNHHLHEMIDKIELTKIVGWSTTVTKEELVKGFHIECFINNQNDVIDAIIDRSIIYSIKKSEVSFLLFNEALNVFHHYFN
jgi:hypothetical protein